MCGHVWAALFMYVNMQHMLDAERDGEYSIVYCFQLNFLPFLNVHQDINIQFYRRCKSFRISFFNYAIYSSRHIIEVPVPQFEGCLLHLQIWWIVSVRDAFGYRWSTETSKLHHFPRKQQLVMFKQQIHFRASGFYAMQLFIFNLGHNLICFRRLEGREVKPYASTSHDLPLVSHKWYAPPNQEPLVLLLGMLLTGPLKQCHPVAIWSWRDP